MILWLYGALAIVVGAALWLWWIRRLDRFEPEPLRDLLRVGLLGGALAVLATLALGLPLRWVPKPIPFFAAAGVLEEVAKSAATLTLLRRRPLVDEPVDVLVYALTVALGFALIENVLYFLPLRPAIPLLRTLYSVPAHLGFTMIWAVPLAGAVWGPQVVTRPYPRILPWVLLAGLVHGATNLLVTYAAGLTAALWMLVPLTAMLLWGRRFLTAFADRSPFLPLETCPFCGRDHGPRGPTHCARCGTPLARTYYHDCPGCGGPVAPIARFCPGCGTAQPRPPDLP